MMKLAAVLILALAASPALAQPMDAMPGMAPAPTSAAPDAAATGDGLGQVKAIDATANTITLHHGPIAAFGWPAMTMTFKASTDLLQPLKVGQMVKFTLRASDNQIVAIQPQ